MIRLPFARVAALFTRPCLACKTPTGWLTALCEHCVSHLPLTQMWDYHDAHDERLRNPAKYLAALKAAREWLATNPAPQPLTSSTAKESSQ